MESLTSKSLISAAEMQASLRDDASNAAQTGLEDIVDELRVRSGSLSSFLVDSKSLTIPFTGERSVGVSDRTSANVAFGIPSLMEYFLSTLLPLHPDH